MQKLFSLLICLSLILACTGCLPTVESPSAAESSAGAGSADIVAKMVVDAMLDGKFTMKLRAAMDVGGQSVEAEITQAVWGDKIAVSGKQGSVSFKMLLSDGSVYMIDDTMKAAYAIPLSEDLTRLVFQADGLQYAGSGSEEFAGKVLPYDEYKMRRGTLRMYVDGGGLAGIKTINDDSEAVIEVLDFSRDADESLFEIPSDYTVIN